MNTGSETLLTEAFQRFEQAAHTLERRHGSLKTRVEQLERQLLDAHRSLEAVLDALDTGVAVVSPEGTLLRTNDAFDRLRLGEEGSIVRSPILAALLDSDPRQARTARLRWDAEDGPRDLAATLLPVGDELETRVLTIQDITEIRREEEEGGRRQRLEALGRMAAELAHEVRNPLGGIRLFASMLRDDVREHESQREMTEQILAATAGLESTVTNLLAFAAPSKGERRRVSLGEVAADVSALLSPACSLRGVELTGPAEPGGCDVLADPEGLRQVLLNLLGNALAACEPGGRIALDVRRRRGRVVLSVTDDGRGIPPEDLPRVFDPFFSRTEGGTGLGLSIVHGIVERHRGRITLDSRPGHGTCATVELPACEEPADE